jgi:5'-methylthioadenosine phosphorylase
MSNNDEPVPIGIIGGSGLYEMDGFSGREEKVVTTPFGAPSETIVGGWISGRRVYFLPRHGRGHRILPTEINHRANIYALRSLGVRFIIKCNKIVGEREPKTYRPYQYRRAKRK